MPAPHRGRARGFSLIEVLIVLLLLGLLAAVAYPSYQYVQERRREAAAVTEIGAMSAALKRIELERRGLPQTLEEAGLGGRLDPWGRPYRYYNVQDNGRGGARKDRRLNPLNTDFDLYSLGRDGLTKPQISQRESADDIIRANNGRFTGRASDY